MKQNKMYPYNEFSVELDDKGKVIEKMPTKRKTVVIYPHEAEYWNDRITQNRLFYELNDKANEEKTEERIKLEQEAIEFGVKFTNKISDEKLKERIETAKNK